MKMTYAQKIIRDLVDQRTFTKWANENGLNYTSLYRVTFNQRVPTYKLITSVSHLIPPIYWFYYTDEEIPYPIRTVAPKKDVSRCKFLDEHKFEYKAIAEKYNLSKTILYSIFITRRTVPSLSLIRTLAQDYDPTDFFIDLDKDTNIDDYYIPHQGDLVSMDTKIYLVVSDYKSNKKYSHFTGCLFLKDCEDGIVLPELDEKFEGKACFYRMQTYYLNFKSCPCFLTRASKKDLTLVLDKLKETISLEKGLR